MVDIGGFLDLKAFIPEISQTNRDCNSASVEVSGGWKNIFYHFLYEIKIEEPPQWTLAHYCWDVFLNIVHFEHLLVWFFILLLEGPKSYASFELNSNDNILSRAMFKWWHL